ncbi:uncharacterized protein [Notamacropus eugenii]|uniref:uncharacterized protein n=1 Tax=Notamacropus eugenii TaxID=9315 RepID=UPI003B66DBB8
MVGKKKKKDILWNVLGPCPKSIRKQLTHKIPVERDSQQILEQRKWKTTERRRFPTHSDLKGPQKHQLHQTARSPAEPCDVTRLWEEDTSGAESPVAVAGPQIPQPTGAKDHSTLFDVGTPC